MTALRYGASCSSCNRHQHLPQELGYTVGHDLLATPGRVERLRHLAAPARGDAGPPAPGGHAQPLPGRSGLFPDQGAGPSPVDRGRLSSKHHLITDTTLAVILTGATATTSPSSSRSCGPSRRYAASAAAPRQRPDVVPAGLGYDHDKYRRLVRELQIRPLIARHDTAHSSGLGRPSPCCTPSDVCASAGKSAPTFTRHSSSRPAPTSAGDASPHCVSSSQGCAVALLRRIPSSP